MMTKTVKKTLYSIGDRSGDVARSFGSGTANLARRFGSGTADVARRIGPRRGLIGLAVLAVTIGGSVVLIRYLRARADERELDETGTARPNRRAMSRNHANAQPDAHARVSY
jgi:hypothetical protein